MNTFHATLRKTPQEVWSTLIKLRDAQAQVDESTTQAAQLRLDIVDLQEKRGAAAIKQRQRAKKVQDLQVGTRVKVQARKKDKLEPLYTHDATIIKRQKNNMFLLRWITAGLDGEQEQEVSKRWYHGRLLKKDTSIKTVLRSRKQKKK